MNLFKLIPAAIVGFIVLAAGTGSFYQIDQGEVGVVLTNGRVSSISEAGLHFKTPFVDEVRYISTQTQALEFKDESAFSTDRQEVHVSFSINYTPIPSQAGVIYSRYGSLAVFEQRDLVRKARQEMKVVVGRYSIDEAIKNRAKLISEITGSVTNLGDDIVKIDSLQVEDIVFSKVVLDAAEKRTVAEMLVNTKEQQRLVAEKEASIQVIQAQAQADSNLKIATAQADAVKLQGEAEAAALRAKNDAIKESPNLVELTKAQKWDGKLPTSFIPGSATPFLNIK